MSESARHQAELVLRRTGPSPAPDGLLLQRQLSEAGDLTCEARFGAESHSRASRP